MRFLMLLLTLQLLVMPCFAMTEEADDLRKQIILDQKRLNIMENLVLDEQEAIRFWPVYRDFQEELFAVDYDRSNLLNFYVSNYQSLNDQQVEEIIETMFLLAESRQTLLKQFSLQLQKEELLPARKILRYLQIEQNIAILEQYNLAQKIPLMQ